LFDNRGPDGFPGVRRDHRASAIFVTEEMVAAPDACNYKTGSAKGTDQFSTGDPRISAHAAMTTR
jgi:hypothetical protein